jgi:hypothetical protein
MVPPFVFDEYRQTPPLTTTPLAVLAQPELHRLSIIFTGPRTSLAHSFLVPQDLIPITSDNFTVTRQVGPGHDAYYFSKRKGFPFYNLGVFSIHGLVGQMMIDCMRCFAHTMIDVTVPAPLQNPQAPHNPDT